jgi:2-oxo-3-hexenedioate decarboxylase
MSTTMPSGEIAQEERSARRLLSAIDDQQQIAPLSEQDPQFDIDAAYRITAEIRRLREARGERVLGRKIGFTNRSIWPEYGVSAPIWGYVYDTTVHALPTPEPFDLSSFFEPRIEPEIVFGLSRAPQPDMDERALLCGVEWVAHGFEIVAVRLSGLAICNSGHRGCVRATWCAAHWAAPHCPACRSRGMVQEPAHVPNRPNTRRR